ARVPDESVDRAVDLLWAGTQVRKLGAPGLHHLRDPVEHLATVVRGHRRPLHEAGPRRPNRVAHVLPRRAGDVLALGLVGPPRLGARELAPDEELVRLLDREPAHSKRRYGSSPCKPPSRPKPDSL